MAFRPLDVDEKIPVGSKLIPYHFEFDVKMDLTRKARLVAGGHMNKVPQHVTYSSVIYKESVRIGFLIAALNGLEVVSADVFNAYLHAEPPEKCMLGLELIYLVQHMEDSMQLLSGHCMD